MRDKTIIIKLGSKGAYLRTKDESAYIEGFPVQQVVDPVGAGDGFAAGILSGILREEPLEHCCQAGKCNWRNGRQCKR